MDILSTISTNAYTIIKYGILGGIAFGFTILLITSVLVHDTGYIKRHPKFFVSETLMMGVLSAIPIIYISFLRGASHKESIQEAGIIFLKIVLIHIGFQLSGVYSVIFPNSI